MTGISQGPKEELKGKRLNVEDPFTPTTIGNYHLMKLLGKGSFGEVYLATNKQGKTFALKEIKSKTDSKSLLRVRNEISILKAVKHPNVIELHEVIQDSSSRIFLVTEYCSGGDLLQYLKRKKTLKELEVQKVAHQVAKGLEALYKLDIMHRDIKLQNLLISSKGGKTTIKIADFGLARYATGYASTCCGTLAYMAPEVIHGSHYKVNAELWSFGVALYVLLSGKLLFKPKSQIQIFADMENMKELIDYRLSKLKISEQCKDLLKQLLVPDYKKRMDKVQFFSHPFVKTTPEDYKNEIMGKVEKPVSKHVSFGESAEETDSSMSSPESETVFYSSHKE